MNTKTNKPTQRRRLLQGLLFGGAASGTAALLPQKWVEPIVEVVTLPAHAATSPADGQECPSFTIPGTVFSCSVPPGASQVFYVVDDTAGCRLIQSDSGAPTPNTIIVTDETDLSGFTGRIISIASSEQSHGNVSCTQATVVEANEGIHTAGFLSLSGVSWTASYEVSAITTNITVSDITLTPDP